MSRRTHRSVPNKTSIGARRQSFALRGTFVAIAAIFGFIGIFLGYSCWSDAREFLQRHEFVSNLRDPASVPPGGVALLEGRIAASVPQIRDGFVVLVQEDYRSTAGHRSGLRWHELHRATPPLAIETRTGVVQIVNSDYQFDDRGGEWSHETRQDAAPTIAEGAVRTRGLVPGKPVMIVGEVQSGASEPQLVAHTITAGDRATYLDRISAAAGRLRKTAFIMIIAVPLALAYAFWDGRRILRAP